MRYLLASIADGEGGCCSWFHAGGWNSDAEEGKGKTEIGTFKSSAACPILKEISAANSLFWIWPCTVCLSDLLS